MTKRHVHTLWCDDIRQEVGNKPSFMGVYTAGLVVESLPFVLPRLAIWIWVTTPKDQPFTKLRIRILRDDDCELAELVPELPNNDNAALATGPDTPRDSYEATRRIFMFGLTLSSVELPANCKFLSVSVETEAELLEWIKLRVSARRDSAEPESEATSPASPATG